MRNFLSQHNLYFVKLALQFLAVCVYLMLVFLLIGNQILSFLVPIFKWEIALLAPSFKIEYFDLAHNSSEAVFLLKVSVAKLIIVGGEFVFPNEAGSAHASTVVGYIWQVTVLFCSILSIWTVKNKHEYWIRLVLGFLILLLTLMLDTPLALLGAIWGIIYQSLDPKKVSLLIEWNRFMTGGGRLMLGLVAGLLVVYLSNVVCHKIYSPDKKNL